MRWTVRGIPRVPWNAEGVFDGVSTFRLDREGKIYEHQVSIIPASILCTFVVHPEVGVRTVAEAHAAIVV